MKIKTIWIVLATISLLACKSSYRITEISGQIIEMNNTFDTRPQPRMHALVQQYKTQLDKEMNEVVGTSAQFMNYGQPQSLLTNFTADFMKAYGDEHLPNGADVGIMNVHGHRAAMPKGAVTVGNLFEIYSFDNALVFLELKGADLKKIFDAYARMGGAGVSANVRLTAENRKVKSVTVDGKPIDDEQIYRIVTLDYLADGNNGMDAFRNAVKKTETGLTLRDAVIAHVRELTRQGKEIDSALDDRITIIN